MFKTLPLMLREMARIQPDLPAQYSKNASGNFISIPYSALYQEVLLLADGLSQIGVSKGSAVGLISENRREWLCTDLAILSLGAADVPRGNDTTSRELAYILGKTEAQVCFVENKAQVEKILSVYSELPELKILVVFEDSDAEGFENPPVQIMPYSGILAKGRPQQRPFLEKDMEAASDLDVATIIFTSGTTGTPKGVMLSHRSFLNQVKHVPELIQVGPEDLWLCVLPVWHSFERVMQYVSVGNGCSLAYSKPVGKVMLADMATLKPTWMASVPRIWESVMEGIYAQVRKQPPVKQLLFRAFVTIGGAWAFLRDRVFGWVPEFKRRIRPLDFLLSVIPWVLLTPLKRLGDRLVFQSIRDKLGGRFVAGISGGGALPPLVDRFFAAAGILLLEGYGITETAPVLGVRHRQHPWPGTVGPVFPEMEVQIRDDEGRALGPGRKGLIWARGPQVMLGYFKDPDLTRKVIDSEGWFNTGDLGMLGWNKELKILGRAKDTIVLRGGENVEPAPIESRLKESPMIAEAVVIGQDQKFLGALVLPSALALELWPEPDQLRKHLGDLIAQQVSRDQGFKDFERIMKFHILSKPFEVNKELSAKQEIKRHVIQDLYKSEIEALFR